jgi:5'-nucleotidase
MRCLRVADQGIDIALQNSGGIADIDAGEMTKTSLTVLPFRTRCPRSRFRETLMAALENAVSQHEDGSGRFLQIAGMTVDIHG